MSTAQPDYGIISLISDMDTIRDVTAHPAYLGRFTRRDIYPVNRMQQKAFDNDTVPPEPLSY